MRLYVESNYILEMTRRQSEAPLSILARTDSYKEEVQRLRDFTDVLGRASEAEGEALRSTLQRVLECAGVLEMNAEVVARAVELESKFGLELGDAIVCASVLRDLEARRIESSHFVTRDKKDFGNQSLIDAFESRGCKVLFSFASVVQLAGL